MMIMAKLSVFDGYGGAPGVDFSVHCDLGTHLPGTRGARTWLKGPGRGRGARNGVVYRPDPAESNESAGGW